jgi:outer membrane receptor protein involved in Fe transport
MHQMLYRSHVGFVAAAVVGAIAQSPAAAQGGAADRDTVVLEEIVVTARKREESLQDVPVAVTAVTAESIAERNIQDLRDLAAYTPGFSYTTAFGRNNNERPAVRGQSTILGAPVAAFFVDGVFLSGSIAQTELSNVERVEVIKGPQSALYGRGTYQGAVNYVTKRPAREFEGKVSATYAQHDQLQLDGSLSGPLPLDGLFYYIGASHYEYGGEYTNTITGRKFGDEKSDAVTLKLNWAPGDNTDINLLTTYQKDNDGHAAIFFQGSSFNNCFPYDPVNRPRGRGYYCGEVVDLDLLERAAREDVFPSSLVGVQRDRLRASLIAKFGFADGYEFTSATGYSDEDLANGIDVSYAGYDAQAAFYFTVVAGMAVQRPPTDATTDLARQFASPGSFWRLTGEDREDFSQEFRLTSPIDRAFRWTLGAYYFKANDDTVRDDKIYPNPVVIVPNGTSTLSVRGIENRAIFGGIEWDFAENWTLTAEARRNEDELSTTTFAYPINGTSRSNVQRFSAEYKSTTPRYTLRWQPTPNSTYYFNHARGTRPGGFQAGATATLLTQLGREDEIGYDEERVKAFELGAKYTLLGGRLSLNLAAYYNDLFNQQLTTNLVNPNTGQANSLITNLGETEIRGLEVELTVRLAENWSASLGYAFNDAEITSGVNEDQAAFFSPRPANNFTPYNAVTNPNGCVTATTVNPPPGRLSCQALRDLDNATYGSIVGKRPPRAPEHQGFVATRFDGTLGNGWGWYVGGDVTYEGSKFAQVHNLIETGDRTYLNLRAGIETDTWSIQLWGKNVTDDDTPLDILRYIDTRGQTSQQLIFQAVPIARGFAITPPRGRQFGVTANYRF